jgi:hypothetical protein
MSHPPDPEMRSPAAANGRANRKGSIEPEQNSETLSEVQARSLRRRFALGYYFATTVAQLTWGALPR